MEQEHTLTIENRKKISATKIEAVTAFSSGQIVLLCGGDKIIVSGSDMKIVAFSKSSGDFSAVGQINSVRYSGGGSRIKGIFG